MAVVQARERKGARDRAGVQGTPHVQKEKTKGKSGRPAGQGSLEVGQFCVEGGIAFLLLTVPGTRITVPHCLRPRGPQGLPLAVPGYF